MKGKYIDFKGKLKAGDRVKDTTNTPAEPQVGTVNYVTKEYFRFSLDDGSQRVRVWESPGTLELLSPSPRVVTLENLEPGDVVAMDNGDLRQLVVDRSKVLGLVVTRPEDGDERAYDVWDMEHLKAEGFVPVQSTPSIRTPWRKRKSGGSSSGKSRTVFTM